MLLHVIIWVLAALFALNSLVITVRTHYNAGTTAMWAVSAGLVLWGLFYGPLSRFAATGPGLAVCIIVGAGCLAYLGMMVFLGVAAHTRPPQGDERAIIVLGAGLRGEEVSDLLRRRLSAALAAHKTNPAAPIVVTGGKGTREVIPEALAMQCWLLRQGVAEGDIILEDRSATTEENLLFAKDLLAQRGIGIDGPIAVATNTFHCYRAGLNARKCGYTRARLIPASMNASTFLQNYLREVMAVVKTWMTGRDAST